MRRPWGWVLFFFVAVGATAVGYILDLAIRERGFGCFGNGLLVVLGALTGVLISQMVSAGYTPTLPETQRVILFSASASALILLVFCAIKSWVAVA